MQRKGEISQRHVHVDDARTPPRRDEPDQGREDTGAKDHGRRYRFIFMQMSVRYQKNDWHEEHVTEQRQYQQRRKEPRHEISRRRHLIRIWP